jgi:ubiquinone/menaquinone biosynthesis C-methylase UbiE
MNRGFSPDDAKRFYDRFGKKQDWQAFYENPAINDLIAHADFEHARAVFELGFGTGRLAERLLSHYLPQDATYVGVDISKTMAMLAEDRLRPWLERAKVKIQDGTTGIGFPDRSFDRFVSVYVLDLLSSENIQRVLSEAHRILAPGGRICLVSLTRGTTVWCRFVTQAWQFAYRRSPRSVGGCRPVELREYLDTQVWRINHRNVICAFGVSSEIVVALRSSS